MGDSCCHIGFICEHYLTFSKSYFRVILCLLRQRNYFEILKKQRVFDRRKGELENAKGREHESFLQWLLWTTFRLIFYHKQSRALFC